MTIFLRKSPTGFLLIEAMIVAAVSSLFFVGLFIGFRASLDLVTQSRTKLTASSLAHDRMEFIRSLPYDSVGTVAGIPNGAIPQNRVVTLNGINFNERVLVEYVDDPADGQDTATTSDSNGISADYKRVKVEYTWQIRSATTSIAVISNVTPRSVETTLGGGTIRINVLDDASQFLPGASVRLRNASGTIDVTRYSDASGIALLSGVPAGSGYEVEVTGPIAGRSYSVDTTLAATTSIPNPAHAPFTVLEADVSTQTFQIGELSDLTVRLLSDKTEGSVVEEFLDMSGVASSTAAVVLGGSLELENVAGYAAAGQVFLQPVTPAPLARWGAVRVMGENTINTEYRVSLYTGAGPYTLVPDTDLPGNAAGFTGMNIDLSSLDVTVYPTLVLGVALTTGNSSDTPRVHEVGLYYVESVTARAAETFTITGAKILGTSGGGSPVYKTTYTETTDAVGEYEFSNIEFDAYELTPAGTYVLSEACPAYPLVHRAGVDSYWELVYSAPVTHSVRVAVLDAAGAPIPGATATLSRPGYTSVVQTTTCGAAYFTGISSAETDFELAVDATGYQSQTVSAIEVDGATVLTIVLDTV